MDDRSFLAEFEAAAIPSQRWSHRAHIRMAFLYLRDWPFPDALARIRSGILSLNRANNVQDTPESGYHETVTVAWARIIASTIRAHGHCRRHNPCFLLRFTRISLTWSHCHES